MNIPVKYLIAKLLKEKGFVYETLYYYFEDGEFRQNVLNDITGPDYGSEYTVEFSELTTNWNDNFLTKKNGDRCFGCSKSKGYFETFSAPTIAEVVMWLYEKHGIWTSVWMMDKTTFYWNVDTNNEEFSSDTATYNSSVVYFNSPTEAYEAAIEYTLNNLI